MSNRFFPTHPYYRITSPYGERTMNGVKGFHNGVDMVAKSSNGESRTDYITAHTGGTVSAIGYEPNGAGNYVYINIGNGVEMCYFHFAKVHVNKGQQIKQGEVIGYMGSTGRSTGAHLHFGIKDNGEWVNPTPYLDKDYKRSYTTVTVELDTLVEGCKGEQVKTLQALLGVNGYSIGKYGIDGVFGNDTHKAVKSYQKEHKLSVDGIVGKDTWNSLLK